MRSGAAAKLCRAHSGGRAARRFTYAPPNEDNMLAYADELRSQLVVLMGGRAAEMLTCEQARLCRGRACPARVCAGEARRGGGATGTLTGSLCTPCRLPGLGGGCAPERAPAAPATRAAAPADGARGAPRRQVSVGAGDDIRRASELAWRMVAEYGLSPAIGPIALGSMAPGDDGTMMLRDAGARRILSVCQDVPSACARWHGRLRGT